MDRESCGDAGRPEVGTDLDQRRNPRNGSGPRGREARGEETVEGVRNPEDGTCRGGNPRERTDPRAHVVEGERNPRRGSLGRETGAGAAASALRGCPSLREPSAQQCADRPDGGRPRGRRDGEEGAGNQYPRYTNRKRAPRGGETLRGPTRGDGDVPSRTPRWPQTPGGALGVLPERPPDEWPLLTIS
jgi:hypothetical protein